MRVGVLGGGQLARMLALAGYPLGLRFAVLDPAPDACAFPLSEPLVGAYDDRALLARLAGQSDVVTYEFENVSAESAAFLAERVPVYPPPQALAHTQERLREKQLFASLDIPTSAFVAIDSLADLPPAAAHLGLPLVLKTRRSGYDGKGQLVVRDQAQLGAAWDALGAVPLLAEQWVPFTREVSLIAVRGRDGATACYPLSENTHREGILRVSLARPGEPQFTVAREYTQRLLTRLDYVGVLAVEFFQQGDGLLANEYAPRVHNSGHWSIEGAQTSQFENHLRAIVGLPLGATDALGAVAMVNCIGAMPDPAAVLAIAGAHLHNYGKAARPGRKVGHVTLRAADEAALREPLRRVCALLGEPSPD